MKRSNDQMISFCEFFRIILRYGEEFRAVRNINVLINYF